MPLLVTCWLHKHEGLSLIHRHRGTHGHDGAHSQSRWWGGREGGSLGLVCSSLSRVVKACLKKQSRCLGMTPEFTSGFHIHVLTHKQCMCSTPACTCATTCAEIHTHIQVKIRLAVGVSAEYFFSEVGGPALSGQWSSWAVNLGSSQGSWTWAGNQPESGVFHGLCSLPASRFLPWVPALDFPWWNVTWSCSMKHNLSSPSCFSLESLIPVTKPNKGSTTGRHSVRLHIKIFCTNEFSCILF